MKPIVVSAASTLWPGHGAASAVAALPCSRWRREIFGNVMISSCPGPGIGSGGGCTLAASDAAQPDLAAVSQALCHDRAPQLCRGKGGRIPPAVKNRSEA